MKFQQIDGVKRCLVGYSGGKELNPTYRNIKDHTEALIVEFDPSVVSYEDLCIEWSQMHYPTRKGMCQYRSAVWYVNDEQEEIAQSVVDGMKAKAGRSVKLYTSVEPVTRFYKAEEYHQNYMAKQRGGLGGLFGRS